MTTRDSESRMAKAVDTLERVTAVERWHGLFARLKDEKGLSRRALCKKHGLDPTQIGHQMSGKRGASWKHIDAVHAALAAEGVTKTFEEEFKACE